MQVDPALSPGTNVKSKCIKYFNIKENTLNLIEYKVGNNLEHSGMGTISWTENPLLKTLISTIDKLGFIK